MASKIATNSRQTSSLNIRVSKTDSRLIHHQQQQRLYRNCCVTQLEVLQRVAHTHKKNWKYCTQGTREKSKRRQSSVIDQTEYYIRGISIIICVTVCVCVCYLLLLTLPASHLHTVMVMQHHHTNAPCVFWCWHCILVARCAIYGGWWQHFNSVV